MVLSLKTSAPIRNILPVEKEEAYFRWIVNSEIMASLRRNFPRRS